MGLCDTVDPMAGSYYMETLTNQMEDEMRRIMAEVEAEGGIVEAIAEGRLQAQVSRQAYAHQRDLESGDFRKVGVNCYREEDEEPEVEMHPHDEAGARGQVERLEAARSERDPAEVARCLERLRADVQSGANVMPALMAAVKAYASVGEMTQVMLDIFGRYQEPVGL
jgi:methylmalonyl-CoA mutase N-terminal domain/subunit